jgi:hypothetical protein
MINTRYVLESLSALLAYLKRNQEYQYRRPPPCTERRIEQKISSETRLSRHLSMTSFLPNARILHTPQLCVLLLFLLLSIPFDIFQESLLARPSFSVVLPQDSKKTVSTTLSVTVTDTVVRFLHVFMSVCIPHSLAYQSRLCSVPFDSY